MIYYVPTKIYLSKGEVLNNLKTIIKDYNPEKIFLITGKNFAKQTGLLDKVLNELYNYNVLTYNNVNPSPQLEDVNNALSESKKHKADLIISMGGGSVLDTGKIVSIMMDEEESILDYIRNQNRATKKVPFIAIPTTAGTGSEVTPFAVFYHNKKKQSFGSIKDYLVYPNHAVIDPILTLTMPKELIASSGLDAFSQALESYWSVNSNPLSDVHAIEAIDLIFKNLVNAYIFPENIDFRINMSKASLEAGLAISQTATTASHAVSYPMTAYFNVPHGFACALSLPEFLLYNYNLNENDCLGKRDPEFVKNKLEKLIYKIDFSSDMIHFYLKIRKLMQNVNAPLTLNEAGINDFNVVLEEGFAPERMNNNPRLVTKESLKIILEKIK